MEVSGKILAEGIIDQLKIDIEQLKKRGIIPKIAIVTVGKEEAWAAYVNQKKKLALKLGIESEVVSLENPTQDELVQVIHKLNSDSSIHGIIVQRPFPSHIDNLTIVQAVAPQKDIDGFEDNSSYEVPVWLAVECILKQIHKQSGLTETFTEWLKSKQITIVGRGITAGKPVQTALEKLEISPIVISRVTSNVDEILKSSDIIISAVGKTIIHSSNLNRGVILVDIGLHRGEDGKLHGDYEVTDIKDIASYYTPPIGGVGPLNLAFLFKNLIEAATYSIN